MRFWIVLFAFRPILRTIRKIGQDWLSLRWARRVRNLTAAYKPAAFDALFIAEGFEVIDSLDYYYISGLDKATLHRQGLGNVWQGGLLGSIWACIESNRVVGKINRR